MNYGIYSQAVDASIDEYDTPLYLFFSYLFVWYEAVYLTERLILEFIPTQMLVMAGMSVDPFDRKLLRVAGL